MKKISFFILNSDSVIGSVYEENDKKFVFFHNPEVDLTSPIVFMKVAGEKFEDNDLLECILDFLR